MTREQDAIDALSAYHLLNDEYNALLDSFGEPGGRPFTADEFAQVGVLMDRLEAARRDYHEKNRVWMESAED